MNNRQAPSIRFITVRDTFRCAGNIETQHKQDLRPVRDKSPAVGSSHGNAIDIGDLLNTAATSIEFESAKLERAISTPKCEKNRPADKRLAAVVVALILLIFIVDLIVQIV